MFYFFPWQIGFMLIGMQFINNKLFYNKTSMCDWKAVHLYSQTVKTCVE